MKMAVLMNHRMNDEQIAQARNELSVCEFVLMPQDIDKIWRNVDPGKNADPLKAGVIIRWLEANTASADYVLVQGDYGLTFSVADWCINTDRIAVYATTQRCAVEAKQGDKTVVKRIFRHVRFRRYERIRVEMKGEVVGKL